VQSVNLLESVTFECLSHNIPVWTRKGIIIEETSIFILNGNSLTIPHVKATSKGYYICSGKNTFGEKFLSRALLLLDPPERLFNNVQPHIQSANLYDSVKFKCYSDEPVTWSFLYGKMPEVSIEANNPLTNTYILKIRITRYSNFGTYVCEGYNYYHLTSFYNFAVLNLLRK